MTETQFELVQRPGCLAILKLWFGFTVCGGSGFYIQGPARGQYFLESLLSHFWSQTRITIHLDYFSQWYQIWPMCSKLFLLLTFPCLLFWTGRCWPSKCDFCFLSFSVISILLLKILSVPSHGCYWATFACVLHSFFTPSLD